MPDHSTICRFRNLLSERGLLDKRFAELDRQLDKAGLILRRGTMLDATVIETQAAAPGPPGSTSDPDAAFAKRQGRQGSSFGYKPVLSLSKERTSRSIRDRGSSARSSRRPPMWATRCRQTG